MKIYDYLDYKEYVQKRVKSMPHGGRGEYSNIAKAISLNSVVVSQVFKGKRDLSLEQGFLLAKYFGFSDLEQEYFQNLIQFSKSNLKEHKNYILNKLKMIRSQSMETKNIISTHELSDEAKSIFYSDWHYSAVRLCVSIATYNTVDRIADRLSLSKAKTQKIVSFLLKHGLLSEEQGVLKKGPSHTHLPPDSPYINRYHASWRSKAIQNMDEILNHERFITFPMSLSPAALVNIKERIAELIQDLNKTLENTDVTTLGCMNIDLFELKK